MPCLRTIPGAPLWPFGVWVYANGECLVKGKRVLHVFAWGWEVFKYLEADLGLKED